MSAASTSYEGENHTMTLINKVRSEVSATSPLLVFSYVIDWVVILAIAAVGGGFSQIEPNRRPFNLTDPSISFPLTDETISVGVLIVIGLAIPAVLIFIGSIFIGLGPSPRESSRSLALRRKLWEWNAGWMGLGVALALAFMITNGVKEVIGKPRPDLLDRCQPDVTRMGDSAVGTIGPQGDQEILLVSWTICQRGGHVLNEGFRSFPSGHSSFSFAGMTYLALWLCAKLSITIPFLNYQSSASADGGLSTRQLRNQAAAPPTYLLVIPLIPICVAIYVSSTRYADFWHHGFDVIIGSLLGIATAFLGFRWYHLPIRRGGGWAWAPRSPKQAFGHGMGRLTYADDEFQPGTGRDLERGPMSTGGGHAGLPHRDRKSSGMSDGFEMGDLRHGQGQRPADPTSEDVYQPRLRQNTQSERPLRQNTESNSTNPFESPRLEGSVVPAR